MSKQWGSGVAVWLCLAVSACGREPEPSSNAVSGQSEFLGSESRTSWTAASTLQPGGTVAGAILGTVRVAITDSANAVVPTSTLPVSLSVFGNTAALGGTTTVNAVAGVAEFNDLVLIKSGTYRLIASAPGMASSTSASFTITAAPSHHLEFTTQPVSVAAGATMTPAVVVSVFDAYGNLSLAPTTVVLALQANPGGSALAGTTTINTTTGRATYSTLRLNRPGVGYSLTASAAGLPSLASTAFDVSLGAAARFVVVSGSGQAANVGTALTFPLVVESQDAAGNVVAGVPVTWAYVIGAGAVTGTSPTDASGRAQATVVLGTVSGLQRIEARAAGVTTAAFGATARALAATQLSVMSGDGQSGVVGQALPAPLVVATTDTYGNPVANQSVAFAVTSGGCALSNPAPRTDSAGRASVTVTLGTTAGTSACVIEATKVGLSGSPVQFQATALAGPPAHIAFAQSPFNAEVNAALADVRVVVTDAFNNLAPAAVVTLALTGGTATAQLSGPLSAAASSGEALFSGLSVNKPGLAYALVATAASLSATSPAFDVECAAGPTACAGECLDASSDVNNCGGCGVTCAGAGASGFACVGGTCQVTSCQPGRGDCDALAANGCETNVATNPRHCGACGRSCALGVMCVQGMCGSDSVTTGFTAPASPWSYGSMPASATTGFSPFSSANTDGAGNQRLSNGGTTEVLFNNTGATTTVSDGAAVPPGAVAVRPSAQEDAVIRYTVQADGEYRVSTEFIGLSTTTHLVFEEARDRYVQYCNLYCWHTPDTNHPYHPDHYCGFCGSVQTTTRDYRRRELDVPARANVQLQVRVNGQNAWGTGRLNGGYLSPTSVDLVWEASFWRYVQAAQSHSYDSCAGGDNSQTGALTLTLRAGDQLDIAVRRAGWSVRRDGVPMDFHLTQVKARVDLACASGFGDCVGDPTNGCEVELATNGGACDRVSVAHSSEGLEGGGGVFGTSASSDARYVVFASAATILPGSANGHQQVYLRDTLTRTTRLVSRSATSAAGNGSSGAPTITPDGRWIVFQSLAPNIVGSGSHIVVFDRVSDSYELADVNALGVVANADSDLASISDDGRFVAFRSWATNLDDARPKTTGLADPFVADRANGTVRRIVGSQGAEPNGNSGWTQLSGDGTALVFESGANNLVHGDTNTHFDVFAVDLSSGAIECVSVGSAGSGNNHSVTHRNGVSRDGSRVIFFSRATNLGGGVGTIYLADRRKRSLTPLAQANTPAISPDGRWVGLLTTAGISPEDTDGTSDAYVFDTIAQTWTLVSTQADTGRTSGEPNFIGFTADARRAHFTGTGWAFSRSTGGGGSLAYLSALLRPAEVFAPQLPASATAGVPFSILAKVFDERGYVATSVGGPITLDLAQGPAGATFTPLTVNATRGAATFTLSLATAGEYSFTLSSPGFASRRVGPITVGAADPASLAIVSGDAQSMTVGSPLAPFVVRLTDAFGNPLASRPISWSVVQGTGAIAPASATTDANGEASATATLSTTSGANSFLASAGGLTAVFSAVGTADAPATLTWAVQPASTTAGVLFSPAPSLALRDAYGNLVDNLSLSATVRWNVEAPVDPMVLEGSTTVAFTSGYAEFGALFARRAGTNALVAWAGPLSAVSDAVTIVPGAVSADLSPVWSLQSAVQADGVSTAAIGVAAYDQFANRIDGVFAELAVTGSGNILTQPGVTSAGTAFGSLASTRAESKTISATLNGVLLATSATVDFTPLANCAAGTGDCNGDSVDGCEGSLVTLTDCGACGLACSHANASSSCAAGTCAMASCNAGYSDCDGQPANGCETQGACGCSGAPPPVVAEVFAATRGRPNRILSDGAAVYWTELLSAGVYKCPASGCVGPPTRLAISQGAFGIGLAGTTVAWTDATANKVYTCTTDCNDGGTVQFAAGVGGPAELAANATHFVWNDANQALYSCPLSGCGAAPTTVVSGYYNPIYLALDATSVYFMQSQLMRCPLGGCVNNTPEVLSTDAVSFYGGIATDGQKVYYSTFSGAEVRSCDVAGCGTGTVVASTPGGLPVAMAVDSCNVYWLDQATSSLYACPKTGCGGSPWLLASGLVDPVGLALDATHIYWTNKGVGANDGSVMRRPKW